MNLVSRFLAIACICKASLAVGQQMMYQEQPHETYPAVSEGYVDDGSHMSQGDAIYYGEGEYSDGAYSGDVYAGNVYSDAAYCADGNCAPCGKEPGCFASMLDSFSYGGWAQLGYHTMGSPARINNHPDRVNMHQMWLYAEKAFDGTNGFDFGGRVDYLYGVDAQDTQAFGLDNGHWDTDWDHGIYGHAIPQLYGEVGYGKTSVRFGRFFKLVGYEVISAPDNFFYSHSYTMNNSEPFTHSGALVSHQANEYVTTWGGYAVGWDSGFEDNGDIYLGGMSLVLTDNLTVTYTNTTGRFNERFSANPALSLAFPLNNNARERGQMHSFVASSTLGKVNYVMQVDRLDTEDQNGATVRDHVGINNYFIYSVCDELAAGLRFEWWNVLCGTDDNCDVYALTAGLNFTPCANFRIRPEVRWDWDVDRIPLRVNEPRNNGVAGFREVQTTFGIDAIVTF